MARFKNGKLYLQGLNPTALYSNIGTGSVEQVNILGAKGSTRSISLDNTPAGEAGNYIIVANSGNTKLNVRTATVLTVLSSGDPAVQFNMGTASNVIHFIPHVPPIPAQNFFKTINVLTGSNLVADKHNDTVTFAGGRFVGTVATTDKITINNEKYSVKRDESGDVQYRNATNISQAMEYKVTPASPKVSTVIAAKTMTKAGAGTTKTFFSKEATVSNLGTRFAKVPNMKWTIKLGLSNSGGTPVTGISAKGTIGLKVEVGKSGTPYFATANLIKATGSASKNSTGFSLGASAKTVKTFKGTFTNLATTKSRAVIAGWARRNIINSGLGKAQGAGSKALLTYASWKVGSENIQNEQRVRIG